MSSSPWSDKGEKITIAPDDEFMIIDSEDATPATTNKRVKQRTLLSFIENLTFQDGSTQKQAATKEDFNWHVETSAGGNTFTTVLNPRGLFFSTEGDRFYIGDVENTQVIQVDLTTPWDILTVSGTTAIINLTAHGMFFSLDGVNGFFVDDDTNNLNQFQLNTPWDLSGSLTFIGTVNLASQGITNGIDVKFNPDGKLFFILESDGNVTEFTLSVSFDLSSTVTKGTTHDFSSFDSSPVGMWFKPDGTAFYIHGTDSNGFIFRTQLAIPWDLSSFFDTVSELSNDSTGGIYIRDNANEYYTAIKNKISQVLLGIKTDGKIIGAEGTFDNVISNFSNTFSDNSTQSSAATAEGFNWFLDSIVDNKKTFTVTFDLIDESDAILFNLDGTKMFISIEDTANAFFIIEFALSTPWDITTATVTTDIAENGTSIAFSPDGLTLFSLGQDSSLQQFDLTTAFDLDSATSIDTISLTLGSFIPEAIAFKPDGKTFLVVSRNSTGTASFIHQFESTRAWNIASILTVPTVTVPLTAVGANVGGLFVRSDGKDVYFVDEDDTTLSDNKILHFLFNTPWDINTLFDTGEVFPSTFLDLRDITMKPDGSRMYLISASTHIVNQYELGIKTEGKIITHDLDVNHNIEFQDDSRFYSANIQGISLSGGTGIFLDEFDISTDTTSPSGMQWSPDGKTLIVGASTDSDVNEYSVSIPFDLASTITLQNTINRSSTINSINDIFLSPDGLHLFFVGPFDNDGRMFHFTLTTPFDISTATQVNFGTFDLDDEIRGMFWDPDGSHVFIVNEEGQSVDRFSVTTLYDPSTLDTQISTSLGFNPRGMYISPNGHFLDVLRSDGQITHFRLPTAWDISEITLLNTEEYNTNETNATGLTYNPDGSVLYTTSTNTESLKSFDTGLSVNGKVKAPVGEFDNQFTEFASTFSDGSTQNRACTPDGMRGKLVTSVFQKDMDTDAVNTGGLFVRPDGLEIFVASSSGAIKKIFSYLMLSKWELDPNDPSANQTFDYTPSSGTPQDVRFKEDGLVMYILSSANDIQQYILTSPFDMSTAGSPLEVDLTGTIPGGTPTRGFDISPDGKRLFVVESDDNILYQFDIITPWDMSTFVFVRSEDLTVDTTTPRNIHFKVDGNFVHISARDSDSLISFVLDEPWDISTMNIVDDALDLSNVDTAPSGIFMNQDLDRLFITGNQRDHVVQFALGLKFEGKLSTIFMGGSFLFNRRTISADDNAVEGDHLIGVTGSSNVIITLPDALVAIEDYALMLKDEGSTSTSILIKTETAATEINGSADDIDLFARNGLLRLYSDGTDWWEY